MSLWLHLPGPAWPWQASDVRRAVSPSLYAAGVAQIIPTVDVLRDRRDEVLALAKRRHASRVRVFGSVARGDAGPFSDVDLLVDFDAESSLLDQVGLIQDLEAFLGLRVDVISTGGLRGRHHRIRIEAIDL